MKVEIMVEAIVSLCQVIFPIVSFPHGVVYVDIEDV